MPGVLIRGGRPWGRAEAADILVQDGLIAAVEAGSLDGGDEVIDVSGRSCCPAWSRRTATWTRRSSAGSGCRTRPATR